MIRSYDELMSLSTFKERFDYLKFNQEIGKETFGFDRFLNQEFYRSKEWKRTRRDAIVRDNACDLAVEDHEISDEDMIIVHHMNPLTIETFKYYPERLTDLDGVISTRLETHNGIHFGDDNYKDPYEITPREKGDTRLW